MSDARRWRLWRGCVRKRRRFKWKGQARREAHKRGLWTYLCEFCKRWHFTSQPPKLQAGDLDPALERPAAKPE